MFTNSLLKASLDRNHNEFNFLAGGMGEVGLAGSRKLEKISENVCVNRKYLAQFTLSILK